MRQPTNPEWGQGTPTTWFWRSLLERFLDALDHPVMFGFAITLVVLGFATLITYGAKSLNWPGLSAVAQHP